MQRLASYVEEFNLNLEACVALESWGWIQTLTFDSSVEQVHSLISTRVASPVILNTSWEQVASDCWRNPSPPRRSQL